MKQNILLKLISVSESSISFLLNSNARFLNFAIKLRNRKFNQSGICNEGAGLVAVNYNTRNGLLGCTITA